MGMPCLASAPRGSEGEPRTPQVQAYLPFRGKKAIYVVRGRARMRWGEHLEFTAEAGPGDFIYVPPFVPHQEINAKDEVLSCVVAHSGQEPIVVNMDIESVEPPEEVYWVDPSYPHP
jgi:uncharacterized RmlC-like cupin family protein